MNRVSCAGSKKSCDMAAGLVICVCLLLVVRRGGARSHSSSFLEVYFDRQSNKVVKNMGTEARVPGFLLPSCVTLQP